jgi:hypothetical protein
MNAAETLRAKYSLGRFEQGSVDHASSTGLLAFDLYAFNRSSFTFTHFQRVSSPNVG